MHLLEFGSTEVGPRAANEFENKTGPHQGSNDRLGNWGVTRLRIWGSGVRISRHKLIILMIISYRRSSAMQNEKICMASAWSYRGGSQAERFSIARIISYREINREFRQIRRSAAGQASKSTTKFNSLPSNSLHNGTGKLNPTPGKIFPMNSEIIAPEPTRRSLAWTLSPPFITG
jgi:hypothetical protein